MLFKQFFNHVPYEGNDKYFVAQSIPIFLFMLTRYERQYRCPLTQEERSTPRQSSIRSPSTV